MTSIEFEKLTIQQYFQLKLISRRQHFLFNLLNLLYFRKREYRKGFSVESNPLFMFIIIPYIVFSEAYFFRQRRYFLTLEQQIVGVVAFESRTEALYISNLSVSPFYRRIGAATYLLNHAAMLTRQLGLSVIELSVNKANIPALRLYAKYSFKKKGERFNSYILRKDVRERF